MSFGEDTAAALECLRRERKYYKDYLPEEAVESGTKLVNSTEGLYKDVRGKLARLIRAEIPLEYPTVSVWWYSVALALLDWSCPDMFQEMVAYVREHSDAFSVNTQYDLFYQFKNKVFVNSALPTDAIKEELLLLLKETVERFGEKLKTPLTWIPVEERKEGYVLVITEQLKELAHGPTKTALDRCKILIENLGKRVLLIDTKEVLNCIGGIPFIERARGIHSITQEKEREWKGATVPLYQCPLIMPDIEEIERLIEGIRNEPPEYVVSIGGSGMFANLASRMLPVLSVGLSPSDLEYTTVQYQTLSRDLTKEEKERVKRVGFDESHVIKSVFTSSLRPREKTYSRRELGLPENGFLMIVVGNRLDTEISDEFLDMFEEVLRDDMYIVVLGLFNRHKICVKSHPKLTGHICYLGFRDDVQGIYERCDLYVNPIRSGGGTSGVEALYNGIPVVATEYGDVAINAGADFCVKDYGEMQQKILQYYEDKNYWNEMSEKAKKTAEKLLDSETEFVSVINEFCERCRKSGKM